MGQKIFTHQPHKHQPVNVNEQHAAERLSLNDRIAVWTARHVGSMFCAYAFFIIGLGTFLAALSGNIVLALVASAFSGNLLQLVLLPIIMVGQNVQARHSELQAEETYHTTQQIFEDAEQAAKHLDAQDEELLQHKGMLVQIHQTLLLVLDHLGIEAMETTDHKLPVARIQGHRTSIDEDGLFISLSRAGIKPELLAALSLETRLAIEKQRPHGQHEEPRHADL